jgi:hypothetical protein
MAMIPAVMGIPTHILLGLLLFIVVASYIVKFSIPSFFGLAVYAYLGIVLLVLVNFQVFVAKRWLPVDFKWHRRNGMLIFYVGLVHATIALGAYIFHVKILP